MGNFDRDPRTQEHDPKRAVGFAATVVLPGEDREEFDRLLEDLCLQYEPEGPVEDDAVQTMANAIWRKRHLKVFQRAFQARMKWGAYFKYPGDPEGFARITQEDGQQIAECMTLFSTKMVETELGKTGADDTEKLNETAQFAVSKAISMKETNDNTTSNVLPDGIFRTIFENAIAKIKAESTNDNPMSAEDVRDIVREVAKKEFETEKAKAESEKPRSIREQNDKMVDALTKIMAGFETALGPAIVEDLLDQIRCKSIELSLARFGDLLTPECYVAELRLNELIDLTIERTHDRLMKLQASRAKKAAANVPSLQPGWAARKR